MFCKMIPPGSKISALILSLVIVQTQVGLMVVKCSEQIIVGRLLTSGPDFDLNDHILTIDDFGNLKLQGAHQAARRNEETDHHKADSPHHSIGDHSLADILARSPATDSGANQSENFQSKPEPAQEGDENSEHEPDGDTMILSEPKIEGKFGEFVARPLECIRVH